MKVSPCPPHGGAAFYVCDFCGQSVQHADKRRWAYTSGSNAAICEPCARTALAAIGKAKRTAPTVASDKPRAD